MLDDYVEDAKHLAHQLAMKGHNVQLSMIGEAISAGLPLPTNNFLSNNFAI